MIKKLIFTAFLGLTLMFVFMPQTANADTVVQIDLNDATSPGSISFMLVEPGSNPTIKYSVQGGTPSSEYPLESTQFVINTSDSANTNTISVDCTNSQNYPVKIEFNGIDINAPTTNSPLDIKSGSHVQLTLADGSTSTLYSSGDKAGIHVPDGAFLTIDGSGTLNIRSDIFIGEFGRRAGIGGNANGESAGTITINGGVIKVNGGNHGGAGIGGGGSNSGAGGDGGTIEINNGEIIANGMNNSAGIGGGGSTNSQGRGGNGKDVTINGGFVMANGAGTGAGIGGGGAPGDMNATGTGGNGGNVSIEGGVIIACNGANSILPRDILGSAIGYGGGKTKGLNCTFAINDTFSYVWAQGTFDTMNGEEIYKQKPIPNDKINVSGYLAIRPPLLTATSSASGIINVNQAVTLTATPHPNGDIAGFTSHQWYSNAVNSVDGATAISGATGTTYSPDTTSAGTKYYFCSSAYTTDNPNVKQTQNYTSNIVPVTVTDPAAKSKGTGKTNNSPDTGDNFMLWICLGTILIPGAGAVTSVVARRKEENR